MLLIVGTGFLIMTMYIEAGSTEYRIRDLQMVMQDFIKEICAIWFVITMRADGAPELEEVSCRAIRHPGFGVTRNFGMTSQNVTKWFPLCSL